MKFKFKNLIFILSILTLNPNNTLGFFGDNLGLDLYTTMDNGTYELQEKMITRESDGFLDDLNTELYFNGYSNCLSDVTIDDLKTLSDGDASSYLEKVIKNCGNSDEGSISQQQTNDYIAAGKKIYNNILKISDTKADNMLKISQIGLYSDGDTDNSPFDIIADLEAIDDIVFEKDLEYPGENYIDLDDLIDNNDKSDETILSGSVDLDDDDTVIDETENDEEEADDINNIACNITDDPLISQIEEIQEEDENSESSETGSGTTSSGITSKDSTSSSYSPVTDSSQWGCDGIFCIQIEYVIKNYDLLIGGKNFSIEGLIKKSNKHLKKFASTSLVQSKMTVNNFELGLSDLNLSDMFYVGVQVTTKPAPILNLEGKSNKTGSGELTANSLIKKYYANLGLDYNRANDLNIFTQSDAFDKNVQSINELDITNMTSITADYQNYVNNNKIKNDYLINNYIDQSLNYEQLDGFYNKFVELENFSNGLYDYANNLNKVVKGMKKIPTSSN